MIVGELFYKDATPAVLWQRTIAVIKDAPWSTPAERGGNSGFGRAPL